MTITLVTHVTDGGAIYLTDNHNFSLARIVIRLDGIEPEVVIRDLAVFREEMEKNT